MFLNAQENINMIRVLNIGHDIITLENRIENSIKINNPEIANIQGLRQFHIFLLDFSSTIEIDSYLNKSFIYQLGCTYFNLSPKVKKIKKGSTIELKKWKKYLKTITKTQNA